MRSIRRMIVSLLVVPLLALVGLWIFAADVTVGDSMRLVRAKTFDREVIRPTEALITQLQHERRMSQAFLGKDITLGRTGFDAQRDNTDRAVRAFVSATKSAGLSSATTSETRARMNDLVVELGELGEYRRTVDEGEVDRAVCLGQYTALIGRAGAVYDAAYPGDSETGRDTRTLIGFQQARESISYEDALLTGALTRKVLDPLEHVTFVEKVGAHQFRYDDLVQALPGPDAARFRQLQAGAEYLAFTNLERRLAERRPTRKDGVVEPGEWHAASEALLNRMIAFEDDTRTGIADRASGHARDVLTRLALAGGLGLLAVVVSVTVGVRMGRRLVRENRVMVATVEDFASVRLPVIAEMVQKGEHVDPDEGLPRQDFRVREVSQVYDAFAVARRAVVQATVSEAAARRGLGEVFVNLARRNQVLLQRLLRLLDGMERKAKGPDELNDLFAIDHLVTRMRRHAEGLVILAGKSAGRTWRRPVPLVDLVRAAVAEVEDYQRVKIPPLPETVALSGAAAADVIHLLAELIENAIMYSPPELRVQVTAQRVAHGLAIEIEDRGLGMDGVKIASLNQTLADAPEFDLFDSARLGMFVIARLAQRHGIRVALRPSPYGGVTAIALLPSALLVAPEEVPAAPAPEPPRMVPREPAVRTAPRNDVQGVDADGVEVKGGLPQRTRRRAVATEERGPVEPGARSPDEARNVLSAMQSGWQRGRQEAAKAAAEEREGTKDER
ncbi:ATP-binding protein [Actinocorallia longicatena]|uniref:histidine kinase n=1 Tax=Actinocorallia longicatena TaxID=111803 RepID=A0ABP6QEV5_9ACTN